MTVKEKMKSRFDELESALVTGKHLGSDADLVAVNGLIASITKFTSVLTSAERDFINAAKMAVAERKEWK